MPALASASALAGASAASSYVLLIEPFHPFFISKRKIRLEQLPASAAPDDFLRSILCELGRGLTEARRAQLEGQRANITAYISDAVTKEFAPLQRIEQLRNKARVKLAMKPGAPGPVNIRANAQALRAIEEQAMRTPQGRAMWRRYYQQLILLSMYRVSAIQSKPAPGVGVEAGTSVESARGGCGRDTGACSGGASDEGSRGGIPRSAAAFAGSAAADGPDMALHYTTAVFSIANAGAAGTAAVVCATAVAGTGV